MTIRSAFVEFTGDFWIDVADRLVTRQGWQPVYWSGARAMQSSVEGRYPRIVFHENTTATQGQAPLEIRSRSLPPLDQSLLARLGQTQSIAVHMMDRMDPDGSFGFHEREAHYHRLLRNGLAILEHCRPDVVVFSTSPHLIYDYVLYQLCRLQNIDTFLFHETAVNGLIVPTDDFERPAPQVSDAYQRLCAGEQTAQLSDSARKYVSQICDSYSVAIPDYVKQLQDDQPTGRPSVHIERHVTDQMNNVARRRWKLSPQPESCKRKPREPGSPSMTLRKWTNRFGTMLNDIPVVGDYFAALQTMRRLQLMLRQTGRIRTRSLHDALACTMHFYHAMETQFPLQVQMHEPDPESFLKQYSVPPEDSRIGYIEFWLYRMMGLRKKIHLQAEYERVARTADLDVPYVYLALHYQPEKSTSPEGGVYVDQFLIADMLAKSIPAGWKVYVKENPFQFDRKGSGELTRSLDFYRRLSALPNVQLVPLSMSPFDLMDRARAVATVTGTSGWESVLRGTPTLAFGHAWYLGCEGVFSAANRTDCVRALQQIADGYRPDRNKVLLFLQALETVGFRGFTIPDLSDASGTTDEDNITAFFEALAGISIRRTAA